MYTVGQYSDLYAHCLECLNHFANARLKRCDTTIVITVVPIKGFVGEPFGLLVRSEQHLQEIGARDFLLRLELGMQSSVFVDVGHQSAIVFGSTLVRRREPRPQREGIELG